MTKILVSLASLLLLCSQTFGADADRLVGAWRLLSWTITDSAGSVSHPFGENPKGMIVYTVEGQMSVQIVDPSRAPAEPSNSGDDASQDIFSYYIAYFGPYEVDEARQVVVHHLAGSLFPAWTGSKQVRAYRLDGDRLRLEAAIPADDAMSDTGIGGSNVLVWERIR